MVKLSEIPNDTILCIYRHEYSDCEVMDKEDFITEIYFNRNEYDNLKVYIAKEEIIKLDIKDYIENMGEDSFEDWDERMIDGIGKDNINLINKILNDESAKNIIYYDGEEVNIYE